MWATHAMSAINPFMLGAGGIQEGSELGGGVVARHSAGCLTLRRHVNT